MEALKKQYPAGSIRLKPRQLTPSAIGTILDVGLEGVTDLDYRVEWRSGDVAQDTVPEKLRNIEDFVGVTEIEVSFVYQGGSSLRVRLNGSDPTVSWTGVWGADRQRRISHRWDSLPGKAYFSYHGIRRLKIAVHLTIVAAAIAYITARVATAPAAGQSMRIISEVWLEILGLGAVDGLFAWCVRRKANAFGIERVADRPFTPELPSPIWRDLRFLVPTLTAFVMAAAAVIEAVTSLGGQG